VFPVTARQVIAQDPVGAASLVCSSESVSGLLGYLGFVYDTYVNKTAGVSIRANRGDWSSPVHPGITKAFTGPVIGATYYIRSLRSVAAVATACGMSDLAASLRRNATIARLGMDDLTFNTSRGAYWDYPEYDQTNNALPLWLDYVDEDRPSDAERRAEGGLRTNHTVAAATALIKSIQAADNHLTTGLFGSAVLLPVVDRVLGDSALARSILTQDTQPGWYAFLAVDPGSTLWETWNGAGSNTSDPLPNSLNHPMFGTVLDYLLPSAAGVSVSAAADGSGAPMVKVRPTRAALAGPPVDTSMLAGSADYRATVAVSCKGRACLACDALLLAVGRGVHPSVVPAEGVASGPGSRDYEADASAGPLARCVGAEVRHAGGHSTTVVMLVMETSRGGIDEGTCAELVPDFRHAVLGSTRTKGMLHLTELAEGAGAAIQGTSSGCVFVDAAEGVLVDVDLDALEPSMTHWYTGASLHEETEVRHGRISLMAFLAP